MLMPVGLRSRRTMRFPCGFAVALGIALLAAVSAGADVPPRVIGFERFAATANEGQATAGELLLGELNCTSCHAADPQWSAHIQRKPAPVLDTVGQRVRPQYLLKFLANPQETKPGTTMPSVLA